MSIITKSLQNGTIYRKLGEICDIKRGDRITKAQVLPIGKGLYPVISGGITPMGYLDNFNRPQNTITIAQYGSAGFVNWQTEKFWANDICYSLFPHETLLNKKFLYYILCNNQDLLYKMVNRDAIPYHLPQINIAKLNIPTPPLEVQNEIVRILDTFTSHTAELQAELQARKEQYEYYRNRLFDLKTGVEIYKLSDICPAIGDGLHGTPNYKENGDYFFINGNNLVRGKIKLNNQTKRIGCEEFCKYSFKFNSNTVFLSINGTIGNVALYNNEKIALGKSVAYFVVNPLLLNVRFLYYYFQSKNARIYFESNSTGSTIKNLGLKALRNMTISVPHLTEQNRIVSILDKFETLVNDLTEGIPAEIAAVQEQYEYYRNKLLSFPKLEA